MGEWISEEEQQNELLVVLPHRLIPKDKIVVLGQVQAYH